MPRNLEFKASISSLSRVEEIAAKIGAVQLSHMLQVDTYFNSNSGRLKLREINNCEGQLIFYEREEETIDRWSNYKILDLQNYLFLKEILTKTNGIKAIVKKYREVYLYKNSRIHIDNVEDVGFFIEFEVIHDSDINKSTDLLRFLISSFQPEIDNVFQGSYSDILKNQRRA
jgi:adenylate cyclase, class 2